MPAVRDIPLDIDAGWLRRGTGSRLQRLPRRLALMDEVLAAIRDEGLLEPAFAYRVLPVRPIAATFAAEVALLVCTIGRKLERRVSGYFAAGKPMQGLLLDEAGNGALRSVCQSALDHISREARSRGLGTGAPASPGDSAWPLAAHGGALWTEVAGEIGVTFTPAGMMVPRKTVSMAVDLGPLRQTQGRPGLPPMRTFDPCSACGRSADCGYSPACSAWSTVTATSLRGT